MSTPANVQSSDAIEAVRAGLLTFVDQVTDALTTLDLEMRRVLDWVEHDRPRHWKTQIRVSYDELNEAQAQLHRCLMFPKTVSDRPACYEERQAVKKAQARVAYCHHKADRVRHWKRALPHEVSEYQGRISRIKRLVEFEVPRAIVVLEKILQHLQAYNATRLASSQSAYSDLALVQEIWPEKTPAATEPDSAPLSHGEAVAATGDAASQSEE
jgi:hypothetical protein